jgi:hypothetical protein
MAEYRSCSYRIRYEAALVGASGDPETDVLYEKSVRKKSNGVGLEFTRARRRAHASIRRAHASIESCAQALWATAQLTKNPEANCRDVDITPKATTLAQDIVNGAYTSMGFPQKPVNVEVYCDIEGDKGCGGGDAKKHSILLGQTGIDANADPPVTVDGETNTRFYIPVLPEDQGELPTDNQAKEPAREVESFRSLRKKSPREVAEAESLRDRRRGWATGVPGRRLAATVLRKRKGTTPAMRDDPAHTYVIVAGDTLSEIAKRFDTSVDVLVKANAIENPDMIRVGETLLIP